MKARVSLDIWSLRQRLYISVEYCQYYGLLVLSIIFDDNDQAQPRVEEMSAGIEDLDTKNSQTKWK